MNIDQASGPRMPRIKKLVLRDSRGRSVVELYNEGRARTCPWIRTRPYRVLLRGQGVFFAAQSSADCITNMSGFVYDRHRSDSGGQGNDFFSRCLRAGIEVLG